MTHTSLPELPKELLDFSPEIALVLGSGLGFFADEAIDIVGQLPYADIEGFPVSTVPGHAGRFVYGLLKGRRVLCMQGRFHFYEGYSMQQLTLPIRLMAQMGIRSLILTNAAGGIHREFQPGDFMLLTDHINFLGTNPLIGPDTSIHGQRFPDMSAVYDPDFRERMLTWAKEEVFKLHQGVYLATTGPSFETPAEIRAFASLGADAVGMSTVPEAITARQEGMQVLGISCITNAAAGITKNPLSHEEVSETADRVRPQFAQIIKAAVELA